MASSAAGKVSREEFRRQKDLEAARKAGTAPAELDAEGRAINPHIPQYISQAPWYLDTGAPSLDHQRRPSDDRTSTKLDAWYDRGRRAGPAATKFRKGACENCGAMTHKAKDCLERPRKKGAKYTGKDIQADEVIQEFDSSYDAKRDRWNGYDPSQYSKVYEEYAAVEQARQQLREEEIDNQTSTDLAAARKVAKVGKEKDADFGSSDEDDEDEDKYADAADAVGQKLDAKTRITVRNLRIREDTAKYLMNLDPESAYYDPKTRSMRDAPHPDVRAEDAVFAGENFLRHSGDAAQIQKLQLFAWQSAARGNDVHLNANPTQGEILHGQYKEKKETLKETSKSRVLDRYGGEEYLTDAPAEITGGQTEEYVEYSRSGAIVKGQERAKTRSKYDEDVLLGNHTSVWGSWYDLSSGQWGFACCHSTMPQSYCTGSAGIEANRASSAQALLEAPSQATQSTPAPLSASTRDINAERQQEQASSRKKHGLGEGDVQLDQDKLAAALKAEKRKRRGDRGDEDDEDMEEWERDRRDKKRKGAAGSSFHNGASTEVTEEELEAYRMARLNTEDPMANYVDTDL